MHIMSGLLCWMDERYVHTRYSPSDSLSTLGFEHQNVPKGVGKYKHASTCESK